MTFLLIIVFFIILLGFAIAGPLGAPWVPAFKKDLSKVIKDSKLKSGQVFYELGCGDGRFVEEAAKLGATAIGYEINPIMWLIAWVRNFKYKNAHVYLGDFWGHDLSDGDVVMTFLTPRFMQKLEDKLNQELKPGTTFVSYIFVLPNKKPKLRRHHWIVYDF